MFPVTLESVGGLLQTYQTPCYGFLHEGEWWDEGYSFVDGWQNMVSYPYHPASPQQPFGHYCLQNYGSTVFSEEDRIELDDLRYIWNSGSVLPTIGLGKDNNPKNPIAKQHWGSSKISYGEEPPTPVDNVALWSQASGISYTRKEFLEALESWIDAGRSSAMVWDHRGFMGVRADVPADRALFYLMVDRELWDNNVKSKTNFIMDQIHKKGRNPMIAFLMSRLVSIETNAVGQTKMYYTGNTGDNCILPDSLLVKGLGSKYKEPLAVEWEQSCYSDNCPHERDEDIDEREGGWYFESEEFCATVSNSMFNPLFMLEQSSTSAVSLIGEGEEATPINKLFGIEVLGESVFRSSNYRYWEIGEIINALSESDETKIPSSEWEDVMYKLLMGE